MKEIWIRSADGDELLLCNSFSAIGKMLYCDSVNNSGGGIGKEYATHDRAMEVLDEIQRFLTPKILVQAGHDVLDKDTAIAVCTENITELNDNGVFQLPKE